MTTNVPAPVFGPTGFVPPLESAVLAGVQSDQNTAFGGNLNPSLTTPQGQLAQSETAIIGDKNDQFLQLVNNMDPAFSSGRMQDGIARIYYLTRIPASSTVVTARCFGLAGTVIPINAAALDQGGNVYLCTVAGTIPITGYIDLTFACTSTGPIACPGAVSPNGFLNTIYQAIPGWDSINNTADGVLGGDVETRADFEFRRANSVALNAQGSLPSVLGAVFDVPGVLDAYAVENDTGSTSGGAFSASMAGTTMTVTSVSQGILAVGQTILGAGVAAGTYLSAFIPITGGTGGVGTYTINQAQTVGSENMTSAFGGIRLLPNSLLVSVYGGVSQDIGNAIWSKKSPGCNYNGNTTVTVTDTGTVPNPYSPPYPTYPVTFQVPTPLAVSVGVSMQANPSTPIDASDQVKAAVVAAFTGTDGGPRARIGSTLFASRFYAGIVALGPWAQIYSILVGAGSATKTSLLVQIDQVPTISNTNIAVTFT